jgi:IS30 family transposase
MAKLQKQTKRKPFTALTIQERTIIEIRYCRDFRTIKEIAVELGRHYTTIRRELAGFSQLKGCKYNADRAHEKATENIDKRGPKEHLRKQELRTYVEGKLKELWSPDEISMQLKHDYPDDISMRISHEAIYQYIYSVPMYANGDVKPGYTDFRPFLVRRRKRRMKKGARKAQKMERRSALPSIEDRPEKINERKEFGHYEDDLMVSKESSDVLKTITERMSRVLFMGKAPNKTIAACDAVVRARMMAVPKKFRKTLTRDNGTENLGWVQLEKDIECRIYFAHPYCSYERGTNENTNGRIRRYFPKKTDFGKITDQEIARVERILNTRPRRSLGGLSPAMVYYNITGVALYC